MDPASDSRLFRPRNLGAGAAALIVLVCGAGGFVLHEDSVRAEKANAILAAQLGLSELSVSRGEPVDIRSYAAAGKTTVVDFYSRYCPPCMALKPRLEQLPQLRKDVVLVEVDINRPGVAGIDWGSPVARQYHLNSIPHLVVFGPDRSLLAEDLDGSAQARQLVEGWLAR